MLIIGAKGFAKEVLEVLHQLDQTENIYFFDDVNHYNVTLLYSKYKILTDENQAQELFINNCSKFTLGIGNPYLRYKLVEKFTYLGGQVCTLISPFAKIGHYGNSIGEGCNIMSSTILTNDILIGKCCLINLSCTIGHDVIIGDFVEVCPGVNISGNCFVGDFTFIGTNSTILPGVKIGQNVVVGAGSVVTKDIPDNCIAVGVPAKVIETRNALDI
jgi:sugar O-acyltransferase (sialic acid O-acetyltransferase NeuD family)